MDWGVTQTRDVPLLEIQSTWFGQGDPVTYLWRNSTQASDFCVRTARLNRSGGAKPPALSCLCWGRLDCGCVWWF